MSTAVELLLDEVGQLLTQLVPAVSDKATNFECLYLLLETKLRVTVALDIYRALQATSRICLDNLGDCLGIKQRIGSHKSPRVGSHSEAAVVFTAASGNKSHRGNGGSQFGAKLQIIGGFDTSRHLANEYK